MPPAALRPTPSKGPRKAQCSPKPWLMILSMSPAEMMPLLRLRSISTTSAACSRFRTKFDCSKRISTGTCPQRSDILSGDQPEGGDGRLRGGDVVVPVGQPKREILTEIADRGRAGCKRMFGVVERARQTQHEVAEMGGGRRSAGDPRKILRSFSTITVPRPRPARSVAG